MFVQPKIKTRFIALAGALLSGSLAWTAPAEAGHWDGLGGYRHVVVHRDIVHRPVVHRVVYVQRPVFYHPGPRVRRVVIEHYPRWRPRYGWHRPIVYRPGWPHRHWHDRPRCWLPERYLCR